MQALHEPAVTALGPDLAQQVLLLATRAPSVHNTQPWQFTVGANTVRVHRDRSRALPMQDPHGRELLLSCGAAVLHAELALKAAGRAVRCEVLPYGDDGDVVATLVAGPPAPVDPADERLARAALVRRTDRRRFADTPVPAATVQALRGAAETEGAWVHAVEGFDAATLAVLTHQADRRLRSDPGVRAEVGKWLREGEVGEDGVPSAALGDGEGGSSGALRGCAPRRPVVPAYDASSDGERRIALVLGTDGDRPRDWVRAGRALARLLLEATARGLSASPSTQVLEVPELRARLQAQTAVPGPPQMVLRVGHPTTPPPVSSGRRPLSAVAPGLPERPLPRPPVR